ncbi:hypothetical protein [Edaphobacillus lindanitolerans]|uniref:Uncharacterized protein n=1 Tax=Edaphobacillus lindanitolerans TaxID=550447 RepID=A0A1U7PLS3_9BACI|nr:hypothetical protein [Edaphobacillus lindanitolerans]SIT88444.1 hypothetical protein SAMN05428946_2275 [Edaphobacillus lindanitolerans]
METRTIGKWTIGLEPPKAREPYPPCGCRSCLNFREAVMDLNDVERDLFRQLGINPALPDLLSDFPADRDSERLYLGHYALGGRLLSGPLTAPENWQEENTALIGRFRIGFSGGQDLQLEFEAVLPWVLEEPQED